MSVDHYENFPVASVLCPPALRPAVISIYRFARTADDIADEGDATPAQRLVDLAAYRLDLDAIAAGRAASPRWAAVFGPLATVIERHDLPAALFADLLSAFAQDVVKTRYTDRDELLDYCRRSADPVGRLLVHLYGVSGAQALAESDAICTALQLANFWQDLSVDTARGRVYAPSSDLAHHGLRADDLRPGADSPATRALIAELVAWARTLMQRGAPLVHRVPGRAGWELRLVVQGGLRILEKIERGGHATLLRRPTLGAGDALPIAWRALWMRRSTAHLQRGLA